MAVFQIVYRIRWLAQVLKGQVGSWGEIIGGKGWKYETSKETVIVNLGIVWRRVMRDDEGLDVRVEEKEKIRMILVLGAWAAGWWVSFPEMVNIDGGGQVLYF